MHHAPPFPTTASAVVAAWLGTRVARLAPLGNGGFSGAPVFLVQWDDGAAAVLKRVATDADRAARAAWVHRLIVLARSRGVVEVPAPLVTSAGATLAADAAGGWWELVPFVTGAAVEAPATKHVAAALAVVGRMHAAWQHGAVGASPDDVTTPAVAPAVAKRIQQATMLARHPWVERRRALGANRAAERHRIVDEVVPLWDRALAIFVACGGKRAVARVAGAHAVWVPLQPVIRDVWFRHVLFAPCTCGEAWPPRVAAVIDLHGAAIDTPATDIARLAGSWWVSGTGTAVEAWLSDAVDAYAAVRALTAAERALVPWLHAAGVVCALDNWFRWVAEEGRIFADVPGVLTRVVRLLDALPAALEWLARDAAESTGARGGRP